MFSGLKRLFAAKPPVGPSDPIVDSIRAGRKEEALRLIAVDGVWIPHREQKMGTGGALTVTYYDSKDCFPVFSSLDLVLPYLQRIGAVDASKVVSIPAVQITGQGLVANSGANIVLNPKSDTEWRFDAADFAAISKAARKEG